MKNDLKGKTVTATAKKASATVKKASAAAKKAVTDEKFVGEVKTAVENVTEKVAETTEKVAEKAEKAVKEAVKKTPARRTAVKEAVYLQYLGKEINKEDLMKQVKEIWTKEMKHKVSELKSISLYLKPEENAAYYVINEETTGKIEF